VPSAFVFQGRRERTPHLECGYELAAGEPAWITSAASSARTIDAEEITRRRIIAGIPAIPADIGPTDLPNEAGLEAEAISYTKGCYLGQEVMARLKSMGQVRRRLLRVQGVTGQMPKTPVPVFAGVRQVGELRSAIGDGVGGWIGLAMLSRMHVSAGMELSFAVDGPTALRVVDAP
jgi:folate-binding protein YgfZ